MIGRVLGPYQVLSKLGEGGMGEVYRAKDTNLDRDVAIKVLPESFALDADRVTRFTREARSLAALNHPNIAAIYGLERTADVTALVMELVEGDDLSTHIARGAIPIAEALPIARQIAEALEAAHEQGIVHRDLKPANIKVRADGTVKVLDFGLAKALDPARQSPAPGPPHDSLAATMTSPAMTQMGMIIGTAAYMSPEQARGKAVDKRADIWAFGVVLYEMLTGSRLFAAEDVSETLAAVLTRDVSLSTLPAGTPPRLSALVRDCLVRDSRQRLRDIGHARIEIARIEAGGPDSAGPVSPPVAVAAVAQGQASRPPAWRRVLPWALAVAGFGAAVASITLWAPWRTTPVPTPRTLLASIGADASLAGTGVTAALSPDGTTLAFTARQAGGRRLFVRRLEQLQAVALAGTDGASSPFFSPDGQWIGFFAGGRLKKVSVTGGAAMTLCDAPIGRGGTWTEDDTIIFTPANASSTRLMHVSASGGTPSVFGTLGEGAVTQRWPQALPGRKGVLYTEHSSVLGFDRANLVIAPLAGGPPTVVVRGGYSGRYVPSGLGSPKRDEREGGHLVYMQQGTLFAVPFDVSRLETTGQPVPALEGIATDPESFEAKLGVSSEGTLVHVPGGAAALANPIDWVTRDGKTSPLRATKAVWADPRFSPDGRKLALVVSDGTQGDIWVYDWARDALTQLTFDPSQDARPVWTPDGRRIVFASDRATPGIRNLYWVNADGTGEVTRLTDSPEDQTAFSWHPGGRLLAFHANRGATTYDLMVLPMDGDASRGLLPGTPTVFLGTAASEVYPVFSPDGRWIAYASNEAGGLDIYVRPFPGAGGPWRISTGGGVFPRWSATSPELLFVSQGTVMSAPYTVVGNSFRAETPRNWSPTRVRSLGLSYTYDLHPDGTRVAAAAVPDDSEGVVNDKVVFFFNFGEYLKKIAPGSTP